MNTHKQEHVHYYTYVYLPHVCLHFLMCIPRVYMYEGDRIHTYANVHAHVPHMIVLVSTFALVRQLIHTCMCRCYVRRHEHVYVYGYLYVYMTTQVYVC